MPSLQEQAESSDCEPCRLATGIGFLSTLCDELEANNIDCKKLVDQVKHGDLKVNDFVDKLEGKISKSNYEHKDKEKTLQLFYKIKKLMFEKRPIERKEAII